MENANATPPSSSNFEQDFINRVKSDQPLSANSTPTQPKEKKKLDKRFVIIAILALVLVATIVIAITASSNTPNKTTGGSSASPDDEAKEESTDILGSWVCDRANVRIEFSDGNRYRYTSDNIDSIGDFYIDNGILSMVGELATGNNIRFSDKKIQLTGNKLILVTPENDITMSCKREDT